MSPSRSMKGQYQSKLGDERPLSAGMSPAQYQTYVLKIWNPKMIKRRCFKSWSHYQLTNQKRLMKKRISTRFLNTLLDKYQRTYNRIFLRKFLDIWVQKMWLVHADKLLQEERVRMRRAHSLRTARESQRAEAQSLAMRKKMCPVCSALRVRAAKADKANEEASDTLSPREDGEPVVPPSTQETARQDAARAGRGSA